MPDISQLRWYRGPWVRVQHPYLGSRYAPPEGMIGGLDLRRSDQRSLNYKGDDGLGIFWGYASLDSNYDLLGVGHFAEISTTLVSRQSVPHKSKFLPQGDTLQAVIWDVLTRGSDPSGEEFARPLMPNSKGQLRLLVGGLKYAERFRYGEHSHTEKVRDVISRSVAQISQHDERLAQKNLGFQLEKYGLREADSTQFSRLKVLKPETEISDDFNRADQTLTDSADWEVFSYSIGGSPVISGNQLSTASYGNFQGRGAAHTTDLSGEDQTIELTYSTNVGLYLFSRANSGFTTFYQATDVFDTIEIGASTVTLSTGSSSGISFPRTSRMEVDGSDIDYYINDLIRLSVTDTSVTSGSRVGFTVIREFAAGTADNFYAADLSGGPAPTEVDPEDCTHAHTAESPTITQVHIVSPEDCTHSHTASSPAVAVGINVAPDDCTHSHSASEPAVTQVHSISPADCTHSHSATSPTITQVHQVSPDDSTHAHTASEPVITQVHSVAPDDCSHSHSAESPTVTQVHEVAPEDAEHSHTAESPTITQQHVVSPDDCSHAHSATSPAITQAHTISPDDCNHGHVAESPVVTQVHVVSPEDCVHAHTASEPTIEVVVGGTSRLLLLRRQMAL